MSIILNIILQETQSAAVYGRVSLAGCMNPFYLWKVFFECRNTGLSGSGQFGTGMNKYAGQNARMPMPASAWHVLPQAKYGLYVHG
jgi:hypothetical protein